MERDTIRLQILRHNGKAQAHTGKTGILGKAADFNRAGSCPLALIDGVRNIRLGNIGLIGRVIEDNRVNPVGVIHPLLQPFLSNRHSRRIIGEA